ncbi:MAG: hypothetical protein KR126chlam5_00973 [Candidatus Anoxychlamydiales bacterium]|nr:hypothetical protein [Candidatus Anoxychlamydiales bacterium]
MTSRICSLSCIKFFSKPTLSSIATRSFNYSSNQKIYRLTQRSLFSTMKKKPSEKTGFWALLTKEQKKEIQEKMSISSYFNNPLKDFLFYSEIINMCKGELGDAKKDWTAERAITQLTGGYIPYRNFDNDRYRIPSLEKFKLEFSLVNFLNADVIRGLNGKIPIEEMYEDFCLIEYAKYNNRQVYWDDFEMYGEIPRATSLKMI